MITYRRATLKDVRAIAAYLRREYAAQTDLMTHGNPTEKNVERKVSNVDYFRMWLAERATTIVGLAEADLGMTTDKKGITRKMAQSGLILVSEWANEYQRSTLLYDFLTWIVRDLRDNDGVEVIKTDRLDPLCMGAKWCEDRKWQAETHGPQKVYGIGVEEFLAGSLGD